MYHYGLIRLFTNKQLPFIICHDYDFKSFNPLVKPYLFYAATDETDVEPNY